MNDMLQVKTEKSIREEQMIHINRHESPKVTLGMKFQIFLERRLLVFVCKEHSLS